MNFKPYYAVKIGRNLGIFKEWQEVVNETNGFFGASYKKCISKQEALAFLNLKDESKKGELEVNQTNFLSKNPNVLNVYVDGSYDQEKKIYSYAFAVIEDGIVTDSFSGAKQNVQVGEALHSMSGELQAAMMALKYSTQRKIRNIIIYYDCIFIPNLLNGAALPRNNYHSEYIKFMKNTINEYDLKVNFTKVQAHSNNKYNKLVDKLANKAMKDKREEIIKTSNNGAEKVKKKKKRKRKKKETTQNKAELLLASISHNTYFQYRSICNSVKDIGIHIELIINNIVKLATRHNIEVNICAAEKYFYNNLDKMEKSYLKMLNRKRGKKVEHTLNSKKRKEELPNLNQQQRQLLISTATNLYLEYRDKLKSDIEIKRNIATISQEVIHKMEKRGFNVDVKEVILLYENRSEKLSNTYNRMIKRRKKLV